jgi:hypothetical protein
MSQLARNAQVAHLARCEVLRPFQGSKDGEAYTYQRGEIVDARPWRHAESLIGQRMIVALPQEVVSNEPRGRSRAA